MRLKKQAKNKTERISFRCSLEDFNRLQLKANTYTEGNLSEYLLYVGLNFLPEEQDFEKEKPE